MKRAILVLACLTVVATAQTPEPDHAAFRARLKANAEAAAKLPETGVLSKGLRIAATLREAEAFMYGPDLEPRAKYPRALALYRKVIALDPANELAKESAETIVTIYESMGRSVPEA